MFSNLKTQPATAWTIVAIVLVSVLSFVVYMPVFGMRPLLDELYLFRWMADGSFSTFMSFHGVDNHDTWGFLAPVAVWLSYLLGFKTAFLFRFYGVIGHIICASFLFCIVKNLLPTIEGATPDESVRPMLVATGFCAAVAFALFPLAPEAVAYTGGRPELLSLMFFLAAFSSYLRHCRLASGPNEVNTWTMTALGLFLAAVLMDQSAAFLGLLFPLWKLLFSQSNGAKTGNWLWPISFAVFGLILMAGEAAAQGFSSFHLSFNPVDFVHTLKAIFIPVNRARWEGYSGECRFMYILLPLYSILLAVCAFKNSQARKVALFGLIWLILAILPCAGIAGHSDDLYGVRWLYSASVGLIILLSVAFNAASLATKPSVSTVPLALLVMLPFLFFEGRHLSNQTNSYKAAARILGNIQKSAKVIAQKESLEFVLARDLPKFVSIAPIITPFELVMLDGATGEMRAPNVPGGPLKDALAKGKYVNVITHYDEAFNSLVPVDLLPAKNSFPDRSGAALVANLQPPLEFWKNVAVDKNDDAIKLESNSTSGPGVSFYTEGLSPLEGDFIKAEAKIVAPSEQQYKDVELHWLTKQQKNHEHEDRRTWTRAIENDGKFNQYLLSLRSTGWTTNGEITLFTIGFPSSATAFLKEVGVVSKAGLVPTLSVQTNALEAENENDEFQDFCHEYPQIPDLGLLKATGKHSLIDVEVDTTAIKNTAGFDVQIEKLDQGLHQENEGEIDKSRGLVLHSNQPKGTIELSAKKVGANGIYKVRAIAVDSTGAPVGRFSDANYVQLSR